MVKTPVLLIGFNRPDNMGKVFEQIRKSQPEVLYIAVDGARDNKPGETDRCKECQSFAQKVDWPCDVHTLFRDKNVGCALGVSGAISWAFESTERLIILEDDCVPQESFFAFCDEMLEKYNGDTRIWQVCGRSYHPGSRFFEKSDYVFSRYAHIWGWATWKRCWEHFDLKMNDFPDFIANGGAMNVYQSKRLGKKSNKGYSKVYKNIDYISSHTWDYQWSYTKLKNAALGIVPCQNLIRNIGGDSGAHATGQYKETLTIGQVPDNIRHPRFVLPDREYDDYHYRHHIRGSFWVKAYNKLTLVLRKTFR